MKNFIIFSIFLTIFFVIFSVRVEAIPAFARKYSMSCQTCHSPFPKLKAYGDEFAGNGFQLTDREAPRYFLPTGDDELSLLREFPVAMRLEGFLTVNNKKADKMDFSAPYNVKFLTGGSIANDIAYYLYFFFSERGEVVGIEDAYIMFNNIFNVDLDLYVGQFQVSDPLFKREVRLTFDDYEIYKTKLAASHANLTYDRGIMLTLGLETGTDIILEVLNGNGIGSANDFKIYDNDKYKNIAGRISQDIGEFLRVGGFVYLGKEVIDHGKSFENEMLIFGPDLTLSYNDRLELNVQYIERKDKNLLGDNKEFKTKGAFAELVFTPKGDESKWYAVGLFNWIESDLSSYYNLKSGTAHFGYVLRRNLRLTAEYTYNFTKKYGQFGLGFVSAF